MKALIRVAVLEDEKELLKEMVDNLRRTGLVEVVVFEQDSERFIEHVRKHQPELLILDIHLKGETTNGVHIAKILKLPAFFFSGARELHLHALDNLTWLKDFPPIGNFNKAPDADTLKTVLEKFIPRVREYQKCQKIKVKPIGCDERLISLSDVSFIVSNRGNHNIYFENERPIIIADKTFEYFKQNGFSEDKFYLYGRSHLLNISRASYEDEMLQIPYKADNGEKRIERINVAADKRKEVKKVFLK